MKNRNTLFVITLGLVVIVSPLFVYKNVYASRARGFGGKIGTVTQCTCSTGSAVTVVGGKFSGTYLYTPGTRFGSSPVSGRNIKGTYVSGGTCLLTGNPCTSIPITRGIISSFQTSR